MKQRLLLYLLVTTPFAGAQNASIADWQELLAQVSGFSGSPDHLRHIAAWLAQLPTGAPEGVIGRVYIIFQVASQDADEVTRLNLANNLAVFFSKQGRHEQAANQLKQTWSEISLEQVLSPDQAARCYFTYAQARMGQQLYDPALEYFLRAIEADANFELAVTSVFKLVLKTKGQIGLHQAMDLTKKAVAEGRTNMAAAFMRDCLYQDRQTLKRVMTVDFIKTWLHLLVTTRTSPENYAEFWAPAFEKANSTLAKGGTPSTRSKRERTPGQRHFDIIQQIFSGRLEKKHLKRISKALRQESQLVALLNQQGRYRIKNKDFKSASGLLDLAWQLDSKNAEAGLVLTLLLSKHAEVDPDGRILKKIVDGTLAKGEWRFKQTNDLESVYNFHCVLATFYQKKKQWGNDSLDFHGAMAQWLLAEKAFKGLAKIEPSKPKKAPILYRGLGTAFQGAGSGWEWQAWRAFTTSSEQYADLNQIELSRQVFSTRAGLSIKPPNKLAVSRDNKLVTRIFAPVDASPENQKVAKMLARQVEWSASGGKIGQKVDFTGVDLSHYDFRGLNLSGTNFSKAKLNDADFTRSNIQNVSFQSADLSDVQITKKQLDGVDTSGAKMKNIKLKPDTKRYIHKLKPIQLKEKDGKVKQFQQKEGR